MWGREDTLAVYNTEMNTILASLDAKITSLTEARDAVQDALDRKVAPTLNSSALAQIKETLAIAQKARVAIGDDCCGANCGITWQES